jgi:hypothetical protein
VALSNEDLRAYPELQGMGASEEAVESFRKCFKKSMGAY